MSQTKNWYQSKTIMSAFLIIASALAFFGYDVSQEEAAELANMTNELIQLAVTLLGAIGAIYGRIKAKDNIA